MNKFLAIKIQQKVKIGSKIPCFFNIQYPTKISDFLGIRLRLFIFTIRSDPNPTFYYPKISVSDLFGIRSITIYSIYLKKCNTYCKLFVAFGSILEIPQKSPEDESSLVLGRTWKYRTSNLPNHQKLNLESTEPLVSH